ncbi:Na(+)-translocating NADH-quinone reductase subunit C [Deltaproteobacteria bacterium TL4]
MSDTGKTFLVAFLLCLVCSILVSTATIGLKPIQERNKALDKKKNILMAAGLYHEGVDIDAAFTNIHAKVVDLSSGEYNASLNPATYDQKKAAKDTAQNWIIPPEEDFGDIKQRAKSVPVYLVEEQGSVQQIILPVYGKGLWGTMYGFVALAKDTNTIKGMVYYEHAETPGLGGEVDNPRWRALWPGKKAYDSSGEVAVTLIKGRVDPQSEKAIHQVDGLSGATLTSRGVSKMMKFWLGKKGFGPYLERMKQEGGHNG